MIRLPGGRKRSERLMKKHSFSNFTNTTNNPLDEDGNEIVDAKRATHLNETKSSRSGRKYLGIHKVKGVDPTTNVIEVGSSSSSSVKGVIPSTKVIEAGSSSLVKGMVPSTNVIAVGSSSSDSDFVASVPYVRHGSSKGSDVDEQERIHFTKKIVQEIKSMSLNDDTPPSKYFIQNF